MAEKGETMSSILKKLRQRAQMSQDELAKAAGIPVNTLRCWEQAVSTPRFDTAVRVARALGVSLDELAKGVSIEPPKRKPRRKGGTS